MKTQWIAGLMAAAMAVSVPVCAEDSVSAALKKSLTKQKVQAVQQTNEGNTQETATATTSVSGAFTESTPLVQYLYKAFSTSPSSISVPTSLFSSKDMNERFEELGQACIEAYIQNGLTDYVTNFDYSYTSQNPNIIALNLTYNNSNTESRQAHFQALEQKAASIVSSVTKPEMTEREKAQALSNYVAQNVKYDFAGFQRYQSGQNVYDLQTAYAGLVSGSAICQGFARAYKLLCDKAGIPCIVVFGTTKQFGTAHAWNRIKLGGKWETVDTSNPQLVINRIGSFCIPEDVVKNTLSPEAQKTMVPSQAPNYID